MTTKGLEYFVGKICTLFTVPTNRDFKSENPQTFPQPMFHYFVGKVTEVNQNGIFLEQWNSEKKLKSFFFMNHIIGLSEEEILDPSNPKDREVIEDYKRTNEMSMKNAQENVEAMKKTKYVDVRSLAGLSGS